MTVGMLVLILGLVFIACAIVVLSIGVHVVKRYPDTSDPRASAPRYTRPVAAAMFIGTLALVGMAIVVLVMFVQALT